MGVEGETFLLTRYCFSLISLGTYALRLCLVCVVDVRVCPRSSVGILEGALDLTADLSKALFLHLCLFGFLLGQLAGLRTVHYQGADQRTSELLGNEKTKEKKEAQDVRVPSAGLSYVKLCDTAASVH